MIDNNLFDRDNGMSYLDGEHQHQIRKDAFRVFNRSAYTEQYKNYIDLMPDFSRIHNPKNAGSSSEENETSCNCLAFLGSMKVYNKDGTILHEVSGNGHHGIDRVGMASVRWAPFCFFSDFSFYFSETTFF